MIRSTFQTPAGRLRAPWRLLLASVLFFAVAIAVTVGAAVAEVLDPAALKRGDLATGLVLLVVQGVALSAAVLAAARYLDRRHVADVGVALDGRWWIDLLVGAALGVALVGGAYLVGLVLGVYEATLAPATPGGYSLFWWLALVAAAMVAVGVYEELVVRGYVLTNLAEGFTAGLGPGGAVLGALAVSSAGFGLLHGANPNATTLGALTIALAGLLLGLGYVLTGSLALPIGVHITWNLTHVLLGLPVSGLYVGVRLVATERSGPALLHGGAFGPEGGVLGLGTTILGCLAVFWYARATGRGIRADVAVPSLRDS